MKDATGEWWTVRDRIPVGTRFLRPSRPALGPTQRSVKWVPGLSRGQSAAEAYCWPLTPFFCRGHGTVELYLYPPSGPHRACNGFTLALYMIKDPWCVYWNIKTIHVLFCSVISYIVWIYLTISTDNSIRKEITHCCIGISLSYKIAQLVQAARYRSDGRGFDSRWWH